MRTFALRNKKSFKHLYGKRFINPRLYLRSQLGSVQQGRRNLYCFVYKGKYVAN